VIELLLTTITFDAAVPPNDRLAPEENPLPETLIEVPPAVEPEDGETEVTVIDWVEPFDLGRIVLSLRSAPGDEFK
jgi:hypothetical protein